MDKALACNTGSQGLNPDTTKDFFNSEKLISAPVLLGTPTVCTRKQVSCFRSGKRAESRLKNRPSSTVCEANTDIRAMYGGGEGGKK